MPTAFRARCKLHCAKLRHPLHGTILFYIRNILWTAGYRWIRYLLLTFHASVWEASTRAKASPLNRQPSASVLGFRCNFETKRSMLLRGPRLLVAAAFVDSDSATVATVVFPKLCFLASSLLSLLGRNPWSRNCLKSGRNPESAKQLSDLFQSSERIGLQKDQPRLRGRTVQDNDIPQSC